MLLMASKSLRSHALRTRLRAEFCLSENESPRIPANFSEFIRNH
jgi:hypothetical protein